MLLFVTLYCTEIQAQDACGTPHNVPNISYYENGFLYDENPICVNVFFHIIRNTNGTGGYSISI